MPSTIEKFRMAHEKCLITGAFTGKFGPHTRSKLMQLWVSAGQCSPIQRVDIVHSSHDPTALARTSHGNEGLNNNNLCRFRCPSSYVHWLINRIKLLRYIHHTSYRSLYSYIYIVTYKHISTDLANQPKALPVVCPSPAPSSTIQRIAAPCVRGDLLLPRLHPRGAWLKSSNQPGD